jgi:hypothetical protein
MARWKMSDFTDAPRATLRDSVCKGDTPMNIQERSCPICRNLRTVDFERWGSHCFNCGRTFQTASRDLARRMIPADDWLVELLSEAGMGTPVLA